MFLNTNLSSNSIRASTVDTRCRVFRRYLQMYPENSEEYIEYLVSIDR